MNSTLAFVAALYPLLGLSKFNDNNMNYTLSNSTLTNLYCANSWPGQCLGLCPNPDLSGRGVRVAFYAQSFFSAILMAFSPEDAQAACWSATLLTASVILPAIIQKRLNKLTVHHAMLCLNFATLSAIITLAYAPACEVWRMLDDDFSINSNEVDGRVTLDETPPGTVRSVQLPNDLLTLPDQRVAERRLTSELTLTPATDLGHENDNGVSLSSPKITGQDPVEAFRRTRWRSRGYRSRVVLSLALITQVTLQWTWAAYLFTSPDYSQRSCSANTTIVMFAAPLSVWWLNEPYHYLLFPAWLLFCMLLTAGYAITLVYTSNLPHPLLPPRRTQLGETRGAALGVAFNYVHRVFLIREPERRYAIWSKIIAPVFCALFVVCSEQQVHMNGAFDENSEWGFGQISALLLAAVPLWSIISALHRQKIRNDEGGRIQQQDRPVPSTIDLPPLRLLSEPSPALTASVGTTPDIGPEYTQLQLLSPPRSSPRLNIEFPTATTAVNSSAASSPAASTPPSRRARKLSELQTLLSSPLSHGLHIELGPVSDQEAQADYSTPSTRLSPPPLAKANMGDMDE